MEVFLNTLAYSQAISNRVGVHVEMYGDYTNVINKMDAGFTYLLCDNIQLDYSFGWG